MAKRTIQQRLIAALTARGYERVVNPRSGRYYEMRHPEVVAPDAKLLATDGQITRGEHKLLLGKAGALRITRKAIADSIPVSQRVVDMLLKEQL